MTWAYPYRRLVPRVFLALVFTLTLDVRPVLAVCGDGVLDAGEACDNTGGCCTPECAFAGKGTSCPDDGALCTRDVCDGAGTCLHDGSPLDSCLVATKGKLQILNDLDDAKDKLSLQMQNAPGVSPEDFGSPTSTDAYRACIFGPTSLLMEAEVAPGGVCDGKPCWVETATGFTYKDTNGTQDGITVLALNAAAKPKTRINVKARGVALADPMLPFPTGVMAQIVNTNTGQCFETHFLETAAVKSNTSTLFDAKAAAPGFEIPGIGKLIRQDDLPPETPSIVGDPSPGLLPPGPDPSEVYVESITYDGTGCPPGSVAASFDTTRTSFTLLYDQFVAEKGPAVAPAEARKQCQVNLHLKIPQGWQYSVATIDQRGSVQLPRKMKATQRSTYYLEGDGAVATADSGFAGPVTETPYLIRDTLPHSTIVWSSCDKVRPLTITTELELRGGTDPGKISIDSTEGRNVTVVGLQWRSCP